MKAHAYLYRNLHEQAYPLLLVFSLMLLLGVTGPVAAQPPQGQGPPPAPVRVDRASMESVVTKVDLIGTVRPWTDSRVATEVPGLVVDLWADEGDKVGKSRPLCRLHASDLDFQIRQASAAVGEAKARLEMAKRELERQEALIRTQSAAQKAYDDARFTYESLRYEVDRLQATLLELEDRMQKKTVRSPFNGVVVERYTQVGEWLDTGGSVVLLYLTDPVKVVVPVPEKYVTKLSPGDVVDLTFDALGDQRFTGKLVAVIPMGDEAARTFPVHIRVDNPDGILKPGMLARAFFGIGQPKQALLVPKDAVVLSGTSRLVFKVVQGTAVPVPVRLGGQYGDSVEVQGDLKADDVVVVRGNERLMPGQPVQVLENR